MTDSRWWRESMVEELFQEESIDSLTPHQTADIFARVFQTFGQNKNNVARESEWKNMAIFNPETNEMDYVDLKILPDLKLNSKSYYSLLEGKYVDASFEYEKHESFEAVIYMKCSIEGKERKITKTQDDIDQLFYAAINTDNIKKIDDSESFKADIQQLLGEFKEELLYDAKTDSIDFKGTGYIINRDSKDIPYFLSDLKFSPKTKKLDHCLDSAIVFQPVENVKIEHYFFLFNDFETKQIFIQDESDLLKVLDLTKLNEEERKLVTGFQEYLKLYEEDELSTMHAEEKKKYLYDNYISKLKQQHKNESIVSKFSDIDLF